MKKLIVIIMMLLMVNVVFAETAMHFYTKPLPKSPNTEFQYTFNLSSNSTCTGVMATFKKNITTDSDGVGYAKLVFPNTFNSTPSYMCEYRNGALRVSHRIGTGMFEQIFVKNITTNSIKASDGAVATPSFTFTNDDNTGFFRKVQDIISFVANGQEVATLSGVPGVGAFSIGNTNPTKARLLITNQGWPTTLRDYFRISSNSGESGDVFTINGTTGRVQVGKNLSVAYNVVINKNLTVTHRTNTKSLRVETNTFMNKTNITGNTIMSGAILNVTHNLIVGGNVSIKRPYATFSSTQTQTMAVANRAYAIKYNITEDNYLINLSVDKENMTVKQSGDYFISTSAIFTVDTPNKHAELWFTKNGLNIPRSNTRIVLPSAATEMVLSVSFIIDLLPSDVLAMKMGTDDAGTQLLFITNTSYSPSTPSIITAIHEISEITP
jgi:hypothetical protein